MVGYPLHSFHGENIKQRMYLIYKCVDFSSCFLRFRPELEKLYTDDSPIPIKRPKKFTMLRFCLKFLFGSKQNGFGSYFSPFRMKTKIIGAPKGAPLEFFSCSKQHGFRSLENENERRTLTLKAGKETLLTGNVSYERVLCGWGDRRQT
jgi:hypothetical protein